MELKEEILNNLKMEHLSGDIQLVAEVIDLQTARKLLARFDGLTLHIPSTRFMDELIVDYLKTRYGGKPMDKKTEYQISQEINRPLREVRKLLCKI